jgi:hypothetical protein
MPSVKTAEEHGNSLALIRPIDPRFTYKRKTSSQLIEERQSYQLAAAQGSLFDNELAATTGRGGGAKFQIRACADRRRTTILASAVP